mmetsp:Transcript_9200/g.26168  ORF Transcript_9200/g.26168 Transcript_9200/m.26168 type:complete len:115 (-) Transcript_9200:133-477(-)
MTILNSDSITTITTTTITTMCTRNCSKSDLALLTMRNETLNICISSNNNNSNTSNDNTSGSGHTRSRGSSSSFCSCSNSTNTNPVSCSRTSLRTSLRITNTMAATPGSAASGSR